MIVKRRPNKLRDGLPVVAAIAVCFSIGFAAANQALRTVDQLTDFSASSASGMFQFAPELLRVAPGETVTFLNSRGSHTVLSQKGLWPDDVPPVDIAGQLRADVVFDQPGIYGVTCRRHGKYGMVMLVAVGDVSPGEEDFARVSELPANARARAAYKRLLEALGG